MMRTSPVTTASRARGAAAGCLDTRGQEDGVRAEAAILKFNTEERVCAAQGLDRAGKQLRAVALGLHPPKQVIAADAIGEAGMVVASRDLRGPAAAVVNDNEASAKARQIDGGAEPRRSRADNDRLEGIVHGAHAPR